MEASGSLGQLNRSWSAKKHHMKGSYTPRCIQYSSSVLSALYVRTSTHHSREERSKTKSAKTWMNVFVSLVVGTGGGRVAHQLGSIPS